MQRGLTGKQQRFCRNLFEGLSQREAYVKAGYSANQSPATLDSHAYKLAENAQIVTRLTELRQAADDASIMDVKERKQLLTAIARTRMSDFVSAGPDGSWVNIGLDGCRSAGLESVKSRTEYDDNGDHPTVITDIKLHDPMKAIDLLNKMDKLYSEGVAVNIDNRNLNLTFQVVNEETKDLMARIGNGERDLEADQHLQPEQPGLSQ